MFDKDNINENKDIPDGVTRSIKELKGMKRYLEIKGRSTEDIFSDLLLEFNGTPYLWGGNSPYYSDCSGSICCTLNVLFNTNRRFTAQALFKRFFTKIKTEKGIKAVFFMDKQTGNIVHVAGCVTDNTYMNVSSVERNKCGTLRTFGELEAMYPGCILMQRYLDVSEWCNE